MADDPQERASRGPGSMSLLVDMATAALDPEYEDARARRPLGASAATRPSPRLAFGRVPVLATTLLLLAGLVTGIAASQVRQRAKESSAVRQSLVDEIRQQTRATDRLAAQEAALRREVAGIRGTALGEDERGRALAQQLAVLELVTGAVAVQGPGLQVTLDDAKAGTSGADTSSGMGGDLSSGDTSARTGDDNGDGRIYDRDLQEVANALWTAGAEHIAVNGQRLTAQTTIRSAGEAILVDFRPLSPPYVLKAVGPVDTMETRFIDGPVARRFKTWTSLYGIGFTVQRESVLRLPAASPPDLRHVKTPGAGS